MSEEIARAVADTTVRSPAEQLATLHRMLRNSDETIRAQLVRIVEQEAATRQALAQLEAAAADNATLCCLLGLDAAGHPGADLLGHGAKTVTEKYIRRNMASMRRALEKAEAALWADDALAQATGTAE